MWSHASMLSLMIVAGASVTSAPALAQSGSLDPTFGDGGIVTSSSGVFPSSVALDASDDIVVAGSNGVGQPGEITRFLDNGTLDTSFGNGGVVKTAFPMLVNYVIVQADGKIVIVGLTAPIGKTGFFALVRFNANGTPDNTFGTNGLVTTRSAGNDAQAIVVIEQPDGKLLASDGDSVLIRYNTNGSLDSSFGTNGTAAASATEIALQSDGSILVNAGLENAATTEVSSSGKVEPAVHVGTIIANAQKGSASLLSDAKLVVGIERGCGGEGCRVQKVGIERLLINGNLDPAFHIPEFFFSGKRTGSIDLSVRTGITVQSDGDVVVGGSYSTNSASGFGLARVDPRGVLDTTFGNAGLVTTFTNGGEITVLLIQGGNILAAGVTSGTGGTPTLTLVRYRAK